MRPVKARVFVAACSFFAAFAVSVPAHATTEATAGTAEGDVVFSAGDLYLVHQDGTGLRRLTWSGNTSDPAWSPGHTKIAYGHDGDVWVLRPGIGKTRLTSNGSSGDPAWSPDGKSIAYQHAGDIWLVHPWGGRSVRVTWAGPSGCTASQPEWAPDGSALVFIRYSASTGACTSGVAIKHLGHRGHVITADPFADDPTFTSDGQRVLYVSECDPNLCGLKGVWETTTSGADRHQIYGPTDRRWFCLEGGICLEKIAAMAGGWMEMGVYADEESGSKETCFQSAAESPDGAEVETAPGFCIDGLLGSSFDV